MVQKSASGWRVSWDRKEERRRRRREGDKRCAIRTRIHVEELRVLQVALVTMHVKRDIRKLRLRIDLAPEIDLDFVVVRDAGALPIV